MYGAACWNPVGSLQLSDTQPDDFAEPLTVAEVKTYLRIDDDDDALLAQYIAASREQAELMQHRHLVRKQYDLRLNGWPGGPIPLGMPVVSVDLVQYSVGGADPVDVPSTGWWLDKVSQPARLLPAYGTTWPYRSGGYGPAVLIRFTVGFAADSQFWKLSAGPRIKSGMLLLISHWYNNRLPYAQGASAIAEYPNAVTACFRGGVPPKVF